LYYKITYLFTQNFTKMRIIKSLMFVFLIAATVIGCKNDANKIAQKWKLQDIQVTEALDEAAKKGLTEKTVVYIDAKGTYELIGLKETVEQGDWTLSDDSKKLTLNASDGTKEVLDIKELTDKSLILSDGQTTMTLIPK